ncbi:dihydrodipicolinate synthase family protein [Leucobacter massiliensis]|uniref:Dihydrodipicolinate synthase family protein n=1 Tax=Leucobacter massiliensis TaxID=1686285 RepID=A0A2S9QL66_9MICO|nr:dihydrodipicolinate synthase family protein [Leucobacter massiliensis]PRI10323.1 dihydrodipicolinate synthase family protein [Leucobacter massiliensis]
MFAGLSAFPLTPLVDDQLDERAFSALVKRLADAGVDSVTALGSTGSYAYLSRSERARVAQRAVQAAGDVPVFVGVGALRTSHVLHHADDAQAAGAQGLLLAPVSYQTLTRDEVYGLFETVVQRSDVPVIVYDNPATTRFTFDDELYAAIARLDGVASIKIPGVPLDETAARQRVAELRGLLPRHVTIGVSGDPYAAAGLNAGCDAWYSVVGGTLPAAALGLARAALEGDAPEALRRSEELQPVWDCFAEHGSLRVVAAIAEHLGLVAQPSLPLPILGLDRAQRARLEAAISRLKLTE